MLIKLVEIYKDYATDQRFSLREIYVNPRYVTKIFTADKFNKFMTEEKRPDGLIDLDNIFTSVCINDGMSSSVVHVVGKVEDISEKLNVGKRLLHG